MEANTKDKSDLKTETEKTDTEKTEIRETVSVTDTTGNGLEVIAKKKPEREFEEPKDETAKDGAD